MPAKPSGKIKTYTVHQTQKNGDIYVLERTMRYDPEKKNNVILGTKLISKIPKGESEPVPTRPKRKKKTPEPVVETVQEPIDSATKTSDDTEVAQTSDTLSVPTSTSSDNVIVADRVKVGLTDILEHVGRVSGIDEVVYDSTDKGTAQKIISIARYIVASGGATMPGIENWQFSHPVPYKYCISEDVYHDLFVSIGKDESLQQNFFFRRCFSEIGNGGTIAFDSTTISSYSNNIEEVRHGFAKDGSGLKVVKFATLYSINTRQPVLFTKLAGNYTDVVTMENALNQLTALGIKGAEIVTDNGYYSEENLAKLILSGNDFITLCKIGLKWVKTELISHLDELNTASSACPFEVKTHGITVPVMYEFPYPYTDDSNENGQRKNGRKTFKSQISLHLYYNSERKSEEDAAFIAKLIELRQGLLAGDNAEKYSDTSKEMISKYLKVTYGDNGIDVHFNEGAIAEANRFNGYFAIVASKESDHLKCLIKYRKREWIENLFRYAKQDADSYRTRVWSSDCLKGRMFVQFVALSYLEYIHETIRKMKLTLGKENKDPKHDRKSNLNAEKKLLNWLNKNSVDAVLKWFDVIEQVTVSSAIRKMRWNTESTQRDKLFLKLLGVTVV